MGRRVFKPMYTVVCTYYTTHSIIELDLYEVLERLRINDIRDYNKMVEYHVYSGQAVEYRIKKVIRDIVIDEKLRKFYSYYDPHFLMYDCYLDLKDVAAMNNQSIRLRLDMDDEKFNKIYGGRLWKEYYLYPLAF